MPSTNPKPLTDRQERFVHEYLLDHNASAAAGRAGYSPRTRGTQAGILMNNPQVRARIAVEMADLFARLKLNALEVVRRQVQVAYLDPAKLFDAAQQAIPLAQPDEDTRNGVTVTYALRSGRQVMTVRQTPRHIALAALQKRLDALEKLQMQAFAAVEKQEPAPQKTASRREPQPPFDLKAADAPKEVACGRAAPAQAAQSLPGPAPAASPGKVPGGEVGDAPPPSPFEAGYDFKKDPNAMVGGRFTAWNKYWREKREAELAKAEEQAALPKPSSNMRMEPGYNPPWLRDNRPQFALGAGECWID